MLANGSTNYHTPTRVSILGCEVSYELPRASRPWNCMGDLGGGASAQGQARALATEPHMGHSPHIQLCGSTPPQVLSAATCSA